MRLRLLVVAAVLAGCREGAHAPFPAPASLRAIPMGAGVVVGAGPGLGPEVVEGSGTLGSAGAVILPAGAKAVVRWTALTEGLVTVDAIAATPPPSVRTWTATTSSWRAGLDPRVVAGTLLVGLENDGTSSETVPLALAASIPSALPAWTPSKSFAVSALAEPSGIDVDYARGGLWVVDDGATVDAGRLGLVDPSTGDVLRSATLGGDLETVRWIPKLDLLLLSNETADELWVVDPESLAKLATAPLVLSSGLTPFTPGGDGFEGLAVTGVAGRTVSFVVANQNDPHALYRGSLTIPDPPSGTIPALLTQFAAEPAVNLSEVVPDWGSRRLFDLHGYVLPERLVALDSSLAETPSAFTLPTFGAEGAAFEPDGTLWVARDSGGIERFTP